MATALRATIDASCTMLFPGAISILDGSLYLILIETDEAFLVESRVLDKVKIQNKKAEFQGEETENEKRVVPGSFWETNLEQHFDKDGKQDTVLVMGEFAFELDDEDGFDGIDIDDGPICDVQLAWAADGDSEKTLPVTHKLVSGELSNCEEDEEFDEL